MLAMVIAALVACHEAQPKRRILIEGFPPLNGPINRVSIAVCGDRQFYASHEGKVQFTLDPDAIGRACELDIFWQIGGCTGRFQAQIPPDGEAVAAPPSRAVDATDVSRQRDALRAFDRACAIGDEQQRLRCVQIVSRPAREVLEEIIKGLSLGCDSPQDGPPP